MIEIIQSTTPSFLISLLRQICSVKGVKAEFRSEDFFYPFLSLSSPFPLDTRYCEGGRVGGGKDWQDFM